MAVDIARFMAGIPSPVDRLQQGIQFSQQQQDRKPAIAANEAAQGRQNQINQELAALSQKEGRTPDDFTDLMVKYPEIAEKFKAPLSQLNEEQKSSKITEATNIYAALSSGNTETALDILERKKTAATNSNDTQEAQKADILIQAIKTSPEAALTSTGLFLANATGDKFSDIMKAMKKDTAKITPFTEIAKINTDLRNGNITPEEAEKLKLKAGAPDEEDIFKNADKLRDEYITQTKDFRAARDAYGRVIASAEEPSAAGDLALIFNYMKVLDPGSVVRESEFATAAQTGAYGERIKASVSRVMSGQRLSDEMRKDFVNRAGKLYKKQEDILTKTEQTYNDLAGRFNISSDLVTPDMRLESNIPKDLPEGTTALGNNQYMLPDGIVVEPE